MGLARTQSISNVGKLIEYFLHPSLSLESDRRHRARILIVCLFFLALLLLFNAVSIAFAPFPTIYKITGIGTIAAFILVIEMLLFSLRRRGNFILCSMLLVGTDFVATLIAILMSGGGTSSPSTLLLAFPPMLGFFFGGIRWGSVVVLMSVLALGLLSATEYFGIQFSELNNLVEVPKVRSFVCLTGILAISGMAYVYEYTAVMLKRERDIEHAKVNQLAHTDALTGLANRFSFDLELESRIKTSAITGNHSSFVLCYLDLNGFKPINDQYGHDVGDEVLNLVSKRLSHELRELDYVARQGGDEFVLIFNAVHDRTAIEYIAKRILHQLAQPLHTSVGALNVGGSLGFAIFPEHATSAAALKQAADQAMYTAKRQGIGWRPERPSKRVIDTASSLSASAEPLIAIRLASGQ